MTYPFPKTVEEAARILDADKPDWYKQVNVEQLNMHDPTWCILGQVYGAYSSTLNRLFDSYCTDDKIFNYNKNLEAWKEEICLRRNNLNAPKECLTLGQAIDRLLAGDRVRHTSWKTTEWVESNGTGFWFQDKRTTLNIHCIPKAWKNNWQVVTKTKFSDLKPGDKFTLPSVENSPTYTKLDYDTNPYLAIFDGNKVATVLPEHEVKVV